MLSRRLALLPLLGSALLSCTPAETPPATVPPPPVPPPTAAPAPTAAPTAAPSAAGYTGHGAASVPREILEKYAPKPLAPELARHIRGMFDVSGPAPGMVSPDGRSLYFTWSVTGVVQVWKMDGPRRFPTQLTGGEDVTTLAGMTPDGARLIVQRDRKGEENPGLYLQDPAGGPLVEVQHKPGVQTQYQGVSDDGRWLYYRANDIKKDAYAIYRLDTKNLAKEKLFDQDGLWKVEDLHGNEKLLLAKETGSVTSEIYEFSLAQKQLVPIIGQGDKEEYEARYGAEGEIILQTNMPSEFRRLYAWKDRQITPITPETPHDVSSFRLDRKRTRILYQVNDAGFTRLFALDARTKKPIALPKLPDADHVLAASTTPDSRYTTLGVDDGRHPLQAYVVDWKSKTVEKWHAPSTPEIDTTRFTRATATTYPARDGTKIPVLVRRPASCPTHPCPVVVTFHGGPEGQAKPGFALTPELFLEAGFVWVEPNVRGSDGYGKTWFHADDGPKRLDVITDIEDAGKWARTEFAEGGKAPRVGVFGGSYGGYSVLMGMTMFAGTFDVGVDVVGISNLLTFLNNTAPYRRALRISEYGDPERDREALLKLSPTSYLDRVKGPLLIIQGASDPRVPAGESTQIHDAVEKKGIPTDLVIFPDEGHGAQKKENRVLQYGYAIAFFKKYLAGQ